MKEFVFPSKFAWEKETYRDNYGKLVIEPLERGYGTTIGNTLRRVLLSSIQGVAITSVRIDGVMHAFTAAEGIKEDLVEVIMNIRQVALKPNISEFPHTVNVEIGGKENILAGDLITDGSVEVLNKKLHIATLAENKKLQMELSITTGRGYLPEEKIKLTKTEVPVGTILIDAIYTPVKKVTFHVENTRVEQFLDYERLILEVWTTGGISPEEAVKEATSLLNKQFSLIETKQTVGEEEKPEELQGEKQEVNNMPVSELKLSTRVENGLTSHGIVTLKDLLEVERAELEKIKNIGKKSIDEIKNALEKIGCKLPAVEGSSEETAGTDMDLSELNLSQRVYKVLADSGIKTLKDLSAVSEDELEKISNLGKKSIDEIKNALKEKGSSLTETEKP